MVHNIYCTSSDWLVVIGHICVCISFVFPVSLINICLWIKSTEPSRWH